MPRSWWCGGSRNHHQSNYACIAVIWRQWVCNFVNSQSFVKCRAWTKTDAVCKVWQHTKKSWTEDWHVLLRSSYWSGPRGEVGGEHAPTTPARMRLHSEDFLLRFSSGASYWSNHPWWNVRPLNTKWMEKSYHTRYLRIIGLNSEIRYSEIFWRSILWVIPWNLLRQKVILFSFWLLMIDALSLMVCICFESWFPFKQHWWLCFSCRTIAKIFLRASSGLDAAFNPLTDGDQVHPEVETPTHPRLRRTLPHCK